MNLFTEIMQENPGHPIIWSIAGSDSSGGAGVQADLKTFTVLGSYGASVLTAVTAQNTKGIKEIQPVGDTLFTNQLRSLSEDLKPQAIKIGLLANVEQARKIAFYLQRNPDCFCIYDPVRASTSGIPFFSKEEQDLIICELLPLLSLITPNIPEAEEWLNIKIETPEDIQTAAFRFCELGAEAVLIKGGHFNSDFAQDFFTNGSESFWITTQKIGDTQIHGTGCSLSSAISHFLAQGYEIKDALVLAKAWQQQAIRYSKQLGQGQTSLRFNLTSQTAEILPQDFPWITDEAFDPTKRPRFSHPGEEFGLYSIVPDYQKLEEFIGIGVDTMQLRNKTLFGADLYNEVNRSVRLAKENHCKLFINDHWEAAIEAGAYGVHLGQDDILNSDIQAIQERGLRLGISTHSYYEAARAHYYRPSYVALGPVYPTDSHPVAFAPQGVRRVRIWKKLFDYPLVAIGGIHLENGAELIQEKLHGICVMSELLDAENPKRRYLQWLEMLQGRQMIF